MDTQDIISSLLIGAISSTIVALIGVRSFKSYYFDLQKRKELGPLKEFWTPLKANKIERFLVLYGIDDKSFDALEPRISYAKAMGLGELESTLNMIYDSGLDVRTRSLEVNEKLQQSDFDDNLIIFGGELSLKVFQDINNSLNVPFKHTKDQGDKFQLCDPHVTYKSDIQEKKLICDFGTVTRIINPITGKLIILLNGTYAAGLFGSVLAITRKQNFPEGGFDQNSSQQIVIQVSDINDNIVRSNHIPVAKSNWTNFSITTAQIQDMVQQASKDFED